MAIIVIMTFGGIASGQVSIARYKNNMKGALSFTFDDGLEEHFTIVYPELEKRKVKATFAIVGRNVGGNNKYGPCVTWNQLKQMEESGHELSNHGWAHRNLTKVSLHDMEREISMNDSAISVNTGFCPVTYVYPGNRTNDTIIEFAGRNRVCTRTCQFSLGSKRSPDWFAKKLNDIITSGEWGVSMTHGITYGYDAFGSVEAFTTLLDMACRETDKLWIAPLAEIGAYVKERESTTLKINDDGKTLRITPEMEVDSRIFKEPLTLLIDKTAVSALTSAKQNGKPLRLVDKDSYYMLDFFPSAGMIVCKYK